MLPIARKALGRDWMEFFTVLVWATVILIMFLSKLKAAQDVLVALILGTLFAIANADYLFSHFRFYKIFVVLRKELLKDTVVTGALSLFCLALHYNWHEAAWPGILLQFLTLAVWIATGAQPGPMVSLGIWAGGKNQMTKIQLMLRMVAQTAGNIVAFASFGLYYSFAFPGEGPFSHFFGLESNLAAGLVLIMTVILIRHRETVVQNKIAEKSQ
mmetsp:Transcript_11405/g.17202  ORF Transcript_11405/g.17202 Transcript_11405/m.17202 type:complete len:214 (-) Transcript_11405:121-762(-)|eukprot:CAMPEP_0194758252 /NCGR_PEP_ID=MMETSP0323_2-20130528/11574_1 /TAXON_ID=2866 ORGANISM="Crypthecodinium cohnii, Strain Seligo" /NCGR_SAMPLE_ID=MMETSP0323_2 /ASSEMBLY_ACC=CAM_ASM_000346 /LENGTH=213 /DNA_ID=CAMNT_0039678509 /DNA_START=58 /DNA_END=699 /DNA_ORIENTATION=+